MPPPVPNDNWVPELQPILQEVLSAAITAGAQDVAAARKGVTNTAAALVQNAIQSVQENPAQQKHIEQLSRSYPRVQHVIQRMRQDMASPEHVMPEALAGAEAADISRARSGIRFQFEPTIEKRKGETARVPAHLQNAAQQFAPAQQQGPAAILPEEGMPEEELVPEEPAEEPGQQVTGPDNQPAAPAEAPAMTPQTTGPSLAQTPQTPRQGMPAEQPAEENPEDVGDIPEVQRVPDQFGQPSSEDGEETPEGEEGEEEKEEGEPQEESPEEQPEQEEQKEQEEAEQAADLQREQRAAKKKKEQEEAKKKKEEKPSEAETIADPQYWVWWGVITEAIMGIFVLEPFGFLYMLYRLFIAQFQKILFAPMSLLGMFKEKKAISMPKIEQWVGIALACGLWGIFILLLIAILKKLYELTTGVGGFIIRVILNL